VGRTARARDLGVSLGKLVPMSDLDEPGAAPGPPQSDERVTPDAGRVVDGRAVINGALAGLAILVAASVLDAILDRSIDDYRHSGARALPFVILLIGYLVALALALFWGAVDSTAEFLAFSLVAIVGVVAFVALGKWARG